MDTECFSFNLFRMARTFMLSTIGRIFFAVSAGFTTFFELEFQTIHLIRLKYRGKCPKVKQLAAPCQTPVTIHTHDAGITTESERET